MRPRQSISVPTGSPVFRTSPCSRSVFRNCSSRCRTATRLENLGLSIGKSLTSRSNRIRLPLQESREGWGHEHKEWYLGRILFSVSTVRHPSRCAAERGRTESCRLLIAVSIRIHVALQTNRGCTRNRLGRGADPRLTALKGQLSGSVSGRAPRHSASPLGRSRVPT
jgi:hypothetical protein